MAQENKAKPQAKPKQPATTTSKPLPGWTWLVVGVIIGLFAALLAFLATNEPDSKQQTAQISTKPVEQKAPPAPPKKEPAPQPEEPRFSFYTDLPKMKVEIPPEEIKSISGETEEEETKPQRAAPSQKNQQESTVQQLQKQPEPTRTIRGKYVLQVGSFKSYSEAEQLKARLAFMGVTAKIHNVSVNNKDRWFRVRVGPYATQNEANAVKNKLKHKRIPAIVLKLSN